MTRTAQNDKIKTLVLTGLFSALIFVFTAYIHVPTGAGYTHAGDGLIYLAASILPAPYAVASGVIGGALADGLSGYPVWIPATILIKAVTALFFSSKSDKVLTLRNILAIIPSLVVCVVGYSLYEGDFFRLPKTSGDRELAPLKMNYLELLNIVNDNDFDLTKAADIIQNDAALVVSLLEIVNHMAMNSEITSVRHAAAMLGQKELKKWINTAVTKELCAK